MSAEQHHITIDCAGTSLTLADTFEAAGLTIRMDWRWPNGYEGKRYVVISPIARRRILDFLLQGAPGPDCCSFCGKGRSQVRHLAETRTSGALICNECVEILQTQMTKADHDPS